MRGNAISRRVEGENVGVKEELKRRQDTVRSRGENTQENIRAGKEGEEGRLSVNRSPNTSTAVSAGCLQRGEVPGHRIPWEGGRLTFLGCYSTESSESYERARLRGLLLLTGCNGDEGSKSDLHTS